MAGADRALLYRLAIETGLRASELGALQRKHCLLNGDAPGIWLPGTLTKNKQEADLPLKAETAVLLKAAIEKKLPEAKVFPTMPASHTTAKMFRCDRAHHVAPFVSLIRLYCPPYYHERLYLQV